MAKRRSKWRKTWQTLKKMMQEARKVKAYQSLRQCPACGNPYSLSITINVDKETDRKSASVVCHACGFRHEFGEIPTIADEFWVYSKVLDVVQSRTAEERPAEGVEAGGRPAEEAVEEVVETQDVEPGVDVEIEEEV